MISLYQDENDAMLKCLLNKRFFDPWRNFSTDDRNICHEAELEIYITSSCNQHCTYCYLYNNEKIYPQKFNDPHLILKNLNILYDWLISEKMTLTSVDFFTGEIWQSQFGLDILECTYQALQRGLQVQSFMIPSNCSFLMDDKQMHLIQNYINKFSESNSKLQFSISIDGKVIEEQSRPLNNKQIKDDDFYENVFAFAKYNEFYFHPMVDQHNVSQWIDNYKWWKEMCDKYDLSTETIMMLEVRNHGWNTETIQQYKDFLSFLIDDRLQYYNYDIPTFARSLFNLDNNIDIPGYVPFYPAMSSNIPVCSIGDTLTVRLGDLAICPCHRTAYDQFLYGYFKVENDKIVDITSNNVPVAIRMLMTNNISGSPKCDTCFYQTYCLHGCFGAQYETFQDLFIPDPTVCDLEQNKWNHIISTYKEIGVLDELEKIPINHPYGTTIAYFLMFAKGVLMKCGNI